MSEPARSLESAGVKDSASQGRSAVLYRIGGRDYPMRSAPQCKVCQSHYRSDIEASVLKGHGYAGIIRGLPEGHGLQSRNIQEHVRHGHLPLDEAIRQGMIEDRATELGKALESSVGTVVDHIAFARIGVQRVFEDIQTGKQTPTIGEAIQLASLLARVDQWSQDNQIDQQAIGVAFMAYMEAIKRHTSPEQLRAIGMDLSTNPVMRGLLGRQPVEAEIIEETVDAG